MAHKWLIKREGLISLSFFMPFSNTATNGCGISSRPDNFRQRRTNADTLFCLSKYSIFSGYLWVGLFP